MRLFVAVDLDEPLRNSIAQTAGRLRARLDRSGADRLAWVKPESWHITLVFLGEIPDDIAARTRAHFEAPFDVPAFPIVFGQPGLFPPRGRPRVLWIGIDQGSDALAALHRAVLERLEEVPFRREKRPFAPHLTLARVRAGSAGFARERLEGARIGRVGGCTIDHVTLYRSHLSPKGATYEALLRAPLR